jgi:hypothetical protein
MDNKTIFVRTRNGEEQVQSRTSHLSGDIKRALSMVDGFATFGEISKRSAPSMRANLAEMFEELEKTGLIQDRSFIGKIPKTEMPPKMVVPVKMATPRKNPAVDKSSDELDFMSGYTASPRQAPTAEAEEKSKREIEAEKIKAQQEAEAIHRKAEEEARLRLEAAVREQREAEAARIKAEQEAKRVREELEAAKLKAEQEARLRIEAAERERKEVEAACAKTEQEAKMRIEAVERERKEAEATHVKAGQEAARIKAEQEAAQLQVELELVKRREELEAQVRLEAQAKANARKKAEEDAEQAREAAERSARQDHEAAHAHEKVDTPIAETGEVPKGKPDSFAFDKFQIDGSQQPDKPQKKPEPQKETAPAQKPGLAESSPVAAKQDAFAFDSFNVDEPAGPAEPEKDKPSGETAKPARPADAREPAQKNVPPPAASETDRKKPGKEELKRQEQERIAAKQRVADEAKAKEMADAQAKVWADAEQRAQETAKAHAERVSRQAEKPGHIARVPRKPFTWGKLVGFLVKLGIFLLVLLVGALFVVPYVLPMRDYIPKVQKMLSDRLHQPVHLGYMSGRILPMPRLDLGEIYIGDAKQFQVATAQINFDIMGVFGDNKPIDSVDFQDVKVRGIALTDAAAWLQQLAVDKKYPVSRMAITQGTLDADVFQLTGVEGELHFSPAGKFTRAKFSANSGKYTLGIDAIPKNTLLATITVRGSALPLLPNWTFDELDAEGEIKNNQFLINEFEARILGGSVQGNARIDWHSGWHAEGVLNAKKIVMNDLSKLLNGNVDGTAHFKMNSIDLAGLTNSSELEGRFTSANGLISGLDIVETARMRSKENLPGGRTHYDGLRGDFSYVKDAYHFKQVKIDGGVLNADATFDINKQQLSGKMKVNVSMREGITADLQLGGVIDNPTLVYVP